jgi:hypothetical protein
MHQLQKDILKEQNSFITNYHKIFNGVMYSGFTDLFKLELDFDWFAEKLKTIKELSDKLENVETDSDLFVLKTPNGKIDIFLVNKYIMNLYYSVLDIIKIIKNSPFG